mmetsp:Transcript_78401/g.199318  ORF Transcript_78401/g.199318 Transcript_78401/m.199318 type:complete len:496 (-) Transcript_78401:96-1583(-)
MPAAALSYFETHRQLTANLTGLIHGTCAVDDVMQFVAKNSGASGSPSRLDQDAIDRAHETVGKVLHSRLHQSAFDTMSVGKKLLSQEHVDRVGAHVKDAKASGCFAGEGGRSLPEFQQLLRNLQVRVDASKGPANIKAVSRLVRELQAAAQPRPSTGGLGDRPPSSPLPTSTGLPALSDATLAVASASLLGAMRSDPAACSKAVAQGVVGHAGQILARDRSKGTGTASSGAAHPELQVALAQILSEVVLQSVHEVEAKQLERKALTPFLVGGEGVLSSGNRISMLKASSVSGEADKALDSLLLALKSSLNRHEYARMWAVLLALMTLTEHQVCINQILARGFLPVLRCVADALQSEKGPLPSPMQRPQQPEFPCTKVTQDPPPFSSASYAPALKRSGGTVKDKWLNSSFSLPNLRKPASRGGLHGRGKEDGCGAGPQELPPMPPLLWILGEDSVPPEAVYRVCDRSLLVLKVRALLIRIEGSRATLVQPFALTGH